MTADACAEASPVAGVTYAIPGTRRRLIPAAVYLAVAATCLAAWMFGGNAGLTAAAAVLGVLAAYHFVAAWPMRIDDTEALAAAGRSVAFPIGRASVQLSWTGLRSRPVWWVLVYSAETRPLRRGLVEVDGVDGRILGQYVEDNPEDRQEDRTLGDVAPVSPPR